MHSTEVTPKEFFGALDEALESKRFDDVEGMREYVSTDFAEHLTNMYKEEDDWFKKELIIHLVQDQLDEAFEYIMHDALNAPSAESKAYSICYREKDRSLFDKYLVDYVVSPKLVEKDAKKYKPQSKWWKLW